MATLYADRGFVSVNGVELLDVENITAKVTDNTKFVQTMTRNRRNKGVVQGNREVNVTCSVAVQNGLGTPKLESIDYIKNDVAMTFQHGADRYTVRGVAFVDVDQSAPAVGTEGKKTFNFIGTDIVDQVGNSDLFSTNLSSITG